MRERAERRLAVQYAVADVLARSNTLAEARPQLLRAICETAGWDVGAVWVVDPDEAGLRCIEMWHQETMAVGPFESLCGRAMLDRGEGLPGRVWATGRAAWLADVADEPHTERASALTAIGVRAGVAFPVHMGDGVQAVAEFFGRRVPLLDEDILGTAAAIGGQLEAFVERTRAESALRASEARMTAIVNAAQDCVITMDHEGRVVEFNPSAERTFGYARDQIVGRPLAELIIPPGHRQPHRGGLDQYLRTGAAEILGKRLEMTAIRASGREFPVELSVTRVDLPGPPLFTAHLRDISERLRTEGRLRAAEEMYRRLVEQIPAVTYIDAANDTSSSIYISPQIEAMTGYAPAAWDADAQLWIKLIHPEDRERVLAESSRTNATGDPFVSEYRLIHRDGRVVWTRDEARLVSDEGGPPYWQGVMMDITERKKAEEQVAFLAYHDPLTGLPNRAMFEELLQLDLARARRHSLSVAVLYMDLDNFKLVNDSLGHDAGDELLRQVAARLTQVSRETDLVARLGGDEFLLLLADLDRGTVGTDAATARMTVEGVARRIHDSLREPFALADTEFYISASIGMSVFPLDARDGADLLKNADAAMYRSKKAGPGGHLLYPSEWEDSRAKLSVATRLRRAVDEGSFVLHYQPIVDLIGGALIGVEALIRWKDHDRGLIPPSDFLPLAEEMGLMEPIGDWVLQEMCRQAAVWRAQGLRPELSFNLSLHQLWQPDLEQKMLAALSGCGDPANVIIEITESTVMTDPDRTLEILRSLRQHGIRFALDDFGTGYSALSRLKDLPVDVLKIDRSFVKDVPGSRDAETMVRTIIQLAHNLGMTPLAEGIETEAQWRYMIEQGCVLGQGFFMSQPLPGEAITAKAFASHPRSPHRGAGRDRRAGSDPPTTSPAS